MPRMIYLLTPALIVLVPVAGLPFVRQSRRRRRLIAGGLLLGVVYAQLAFALRGEVAVGSLLALVGTDLGGPFLPVIAGLCGLAGLFGFEANAVDDRRYYPWYLMSLSALLALCSAGSLPLVALLLAAASVCAAKLLPAEMKKRFGIGMAAAFALVLVGMACTGQWSFLSGGTRAGGWLGAALLTIGFGLHALVCQRTAAPGPTAVLLCGGLVSADLLAAARVLGQLYDPAVLAASPVRGLLAPALLVCGVAAGALAVRSGLLFDRLSWLAAAQMLTALFGLCLAQRDAFAGALLQALFSAAAISALLLCCAAFRYTQGKTQVAGLEGIGRQMPIALFCFGCAAFGLVGLPPFAGGVPRWYLAQGALEALPFGAVCAMMLLLIGGLSALALLAPLARGFFPGKGYEPDTKMHYGAAIGVPLLVLTVVLLLVGLLPAPMTAVAQAAAGLAGLG